MSDINTLFNNIGGLSKTKVDTFSACSIDLKFKEDIKNENDYQTFFEKENIEKYIESYPKTQVEMKVLCRVPIPD